MEILRRVDAAIRDGAPAPELKAIGELMRSCGGYDRDEAICQDEHPPGSGLAALSHVQALPAPTQYLIARSGDMAPQAESNPIRVPFDTGGGLITQWFGSAVTFDPGGYDAGDVIQHSTEVQLSFNDREQVVTNGSNVAWLPFTAFRPGWLPLVRIVGNRDQLIVRCRNQQPNVVPPSVTISAVVQFGFLSTADIFAALARLGA